MGVTPNLGIEFADGSAVPSRENWVEKPIRSVDARVKAYIESRVQGGLTTATTTATGDMTVSHSLGVTPKSATGNIQGTGLFFATVVSKTSTTVTFRIHRNTGVAVDATSIPLNWTVVA